MRQKPYYSVRTGKNPLSGSIDFPMLLKLFRTLYVHFDDEGYFQEDLGYHCVDSGFVSGARDYDPEGVLVLELRKSNLCPIRSRLDDYSEDDLFDVIEFLYDHCSKPIDRTWHSWNDCGWHCSTFDRESGRAEYREKMNRILQIYMDGFELSVDGEVLSLPDSGLEELLDAALPSVDPDNIEARIEAARRKFRRYRSPLDERRDAIRDLADVLEYLRPKMKGILMSKDEGDLFNLANNFGIRHHNELQKVHYDKAIWYSWLFYYYLATIHAVLRLVAKAQAGKSTPGSSVPGA
jgi:hypothetical protein